MAGKDHTLVANRAVLAAREQPPVRQRQQGSNAAGVRGQDTAAVVDTAAAIPSGDAAVGQDSQRPRRRAELKDGRPIAADKAVISSAEQASLCRPGQLPQPAQSLMEAFFTAADHPIGPGAEDPAGSWKQGEDGAVMSGMLTDQLPRTPALPDPHGAITAAAPQPTALILSQRGHREVVARKDLVEGTISPDADGGVSATRRDGAVGQRLHSPDVAAMTIAERRQVGRREFVEQVAAEDVLDPLRDHRTVMPEIVIKDDEGSSRWGDTMGHLSRRAAGKKSCVSTGKLSGIVEIDHEGQRRADRIRAVVNPVEVTGERLAGPVTAAAKSAVDAHEPAAAVVLRQVRTKTHQQRSRELRVVDDLAIVGPIRGRIV